MRKPYRFYSLAKPVSAISGDDNVVLAINGMRLLVGRIRVCRRDADLFFSARNCDSHGTNITFTTCRATLEERTRPTGTRHFSNRNGRPSRKPEHITASTSPRRSGCDSFHAASCQLSTCLLSILLPMMVPSRLQVEALAGATILLRPNPTQQHQCTRRHGYPPFASAMSTGRSRPPSTI